MTGHEIAELLYFTVRTAPKHLMNDLTNRDAAKGDRAAKRIAELLAERLRGYPVFCAARARDWGGFPGPSGGSIG
ncbi:hypothetical protein [Sphingomonas alba]|uniref:Uncharacterized protein n=1 Tax=Sphingomonas alba TaxID=2908208 RepID=A0ABT0RP80_9SPHN|nr:hypothetical protein [Sphingomonas alba]MCL6684461.1 hypothetical protein [Sphingomonas alba]